MATQSTALAYINGGWRSSDKAKNEPAGGGLGIDFDGKYGFQCKDLANDYASKLGAPFPAGNAIVLQEGAPAGWSYVTSPQAGDVALRDYVSGGVNYGDAVLVKSVSGNNVTILGQNQVDISATHGHVPTEATHPKTFYKKFLRRKYDAPAPAPKPAPASNSTAKLPAVNSRIQLVGTQTRTTYKPGTTTVAGHIEATNNIYVVRGHDPKYSGRILINSASGGGNGVALALYYTNGSNVGGWKQV